MSSSTLMDSLTSKSKTRYMTKEFLGRVSTVDLLLVVGMADDDHDGDELVHIYVF